MHTHFFAQILFLGCVISDIGDNDNIIIIMEVLFAVFGQLVIEEESDTCVETIEGYLAYLDYILLLG